MSNTLINHILSPLYKAIVNQLSVNYTTNDLIRLGKNNDGGYVILKSSLNYYKSLLSFGIAGDISFEKSFQESNGCVVNCFDPSIDNLPEALVDSSFFKLGIDSKTHDEYVNLDKALKLSKIDLESKIFMKMDIEGYEWDVLGDSSSFEILKNFEQIVMELHIKYLIGKSKFWLPIELVKRYFILKRLKKYFYLYNTNANNVCGYIKFKSFVFPNVVEVSLINKRFQNEFSNNLNQPSDPNISNIQEFILKRN
jgi:hypothetical protein